MPACTAAPDDEAESGESAYRSKPNGPDQSGGTLVVLAPPGAAGAPLAPSKVEMQSASGTAALGSPLSGLQVGQHTFSVSSLGQDGLTASMSAAVAVAAGATVQVQLGGARINRTGMPVTLGVVTSSPLAGELTKTTSTNMTPSRAGLSVGSTANGKSIVAVAPGEYTFAWGYGDGVVVPVGANDTVSLDAWDYAQRRVARLVPPARELPDACKEGYAMSVMNGAFGTTFALHDEALEIGQNDVLHQRLYRQGASNIEVRFPCVSTSYILPLGNKGAGPTQVKIGRLDVDDVDVAMPDGSKKKVRGTYYVLDAKGEQVVRTAFPTNTGIDLPPGTYKLRVFYPQSAGTNGSYEETFTTP